MQIASGYPLTQKPKSMFRLNSFHALYFANKWANEWAKSKSKSN
jgi:hypothetical protein